MLTINFGADWIICAFILPVVAKTARRVSDMYLYFIMKYFFSSEIGYARGVVPSILIILAVLSRFINPYARLYT